MKKEKVIEINKKKNSGIETQSTHYTDCVSINKVVIRVDLEVNILALILNRKDDASIFIEIYNNNVPENILQNNYISFSFEYNDLESYQFDGHLQEEINNTLALSDKYRL